MELRRKYQSNLPRELCRRRESTQTPSHPIFSHIVKQTPSSAASETDIPDPRNNTSLPASAFLANIYRYGGIRLEGIEPTRSHLLGKSALAMSLLIDVLGVPRPKAWPFRNTLHRNEERQQTAPETILLAVIFSICAPVCMSFDRNSSRILKLLSMTFSSVSVSVTKIMPRSLSIVYATNLILVRYPTRKFLPCSDHFNYNSPTKGFSVSSRSSRSSSSEGSSA